MKLSNALGSLLLSAVLALSGCGGGGGSDAGSNVPSGSGSSGGSNQPTGPDLSAAATVAQLTASYSADTQVVTLSWKDSFASGTQYAVQAQPIGGSFATVETLVGAGGAGTQLKWQRPLTQSTSFKVQALSATGSGTTLMTAQQQSTVLVTVPSAAPEIALSTSDPVTGSVVLSVKDGYQYPSVNWYVDTRLIGQGAVSGGNPITWNTTSETNDLHLLIARIQTSTDSYSDIRRTVGVSNVNLALAASVSGTTGSINIDVSASSLVGIARVEATFDSTALGSLTEPNACSRYCGSSNNLYRFTIDAALAGSGEHSMRIVAVDRQNNRKTITTAVPVNNKPGLTVTAPVDGALVYGTLLLNGTTSTDKAGAVTTTASLGELQFMNTAAVNFSGQLDLTGFPAKTYTLTVTAKDSTGAATVVQRSVTVTSSPSLVYAPILDLGTGGQLIAAEGKRLLYRSGQESYRLRDVDAKTEVTLTGASTVANATDWQVSGGQVYVQGKDSECVVTCIYQWGADGTRTNLTLANPYSTTSDVGGGYFYDLNPVAKGDYVIWANWAGLNNGHYTLYNRVTKSFTKISRPAGMNYVGNTDFDATISGGSLRFFYWGQTGGEGTASSFDVYRWDANTSTSTKLSGGGARNIYPQTDGTGVIWQQSAVGSTESGSTLISQALAGGALTTLATNASGLKAADGVASWVETSNTLRVLKARYGGSVKILSSLSTASLYGTAGGHVVYAEQGKTYSWSAVTNTSTLRLETAPGQVLISDGYLYFVLGNGQTVYRTSL